ncbi:MAG: hypothetical protein K0U41_07085 [Gammaproteobacteria bacterium]|nr:hypothetical protein [Gammaproteobacteria bacterium]
MTERILDIENVYWSTNKHIAIRKEFSIQEKIWVNNYALWEDERREEYKRFGIDQDEAVYIETNKQIITVKRFSMGNLSRTSSDLFQFAYVGGCFSSRNKQIDLRLGIERRYRAMLYVVTDNNKLKIELGSLGILSAYRIVTIESNQLTTRFYI